MPIALPQTHISQQGSREALRGDGENNRQPNRTPSSLPLSIPGYGGLRYDIQHLSPVSAARAVEGIDASFMFHNLESITDDQNRYIAFQLHVPVAVRVYEPDIQALRQNRVTCNCIDYQSTQSACAHLYWLFARLNGVLRGDQQESQQDSTQIEVISGLSALYPLIDQQRDVLRRDLKDELELDSDESIFEDSTWDNPSHNEAAEPNDHLILHSNSTS